MPLIKDGPKNKRISRNIRELITTKPSKSRAKAISTIAKREGISKKQAKQRQAIAIALRSEEAK